MKNILLLALLILFGCQNNNEVLTKLDLLSKQTNDLENKIDKIEKNQDGILNQLSPPIAMYEDPFDLIKKEFTNRWKWSGLYIQSTFWYKNRDEVLKTLEMVDFQQNGRIGIAFLRYSVGTNIFRTIQWVIEENKFWYLMISGLSKYNADDYNDSEKFLEWVEKMYEKGEDWEKESAKMFFNRNEQ